MFMPEHISGTGDPMALAGMEGFFGHHTLETGNDPYFPIPEEAIEPDYDSQNYMEMIDEVARLYQRDSSFKLDPIRQIKAIRRQLDEVNRTVQRLNADNEKRDRKEQYIFIGLIGLASITLLSFFRK